jgi:hypothetical protein
MQIAGFSRPRERARAGKLQIERFAVSCARAAAMARQFAFRNLQFAICNSVQTKRTFGTGARAAFQTCSARLA